jgi:ubiquitin carboxyl-terminal hydrolase 4/11
MGGKKTKGVALKSRKAAAAAAIAIRDAANDFKDEGNAAFSQLHYQQAVDAYTAGLVLLTSNESSDEALTAAATTTTATLLLSNRAMAYLKLCAFAEAEADCTTCLNWFRKKNPDDKDDAQQQQQQQQQCHIQQAKVWYRRAWAREGLATISNNNNNNNNIPTTTTPEQWLLAANQDLQHAIAAIERSSVSKNGNKDNVYPAPQLGTVADNTNRSVLVMAARIQKTLGALRMSNNTTDSNNNNTESNENGRSQHSSTLEPREMTNGSPPAAAVIYRPSPEEQRQIVLRLLIGRVTALHQHQQQQQQQQQHKVLALPGEAFFLLDWSWWCDWCRHVAFFDSQPAQPQSNGTTNNYHHYSSRDTKLLGFLLPGASIPEPLPVLPKDNDDNSTNGNSHASNGTNMPHTAPPPPGPLNNRNLVLEFIPKISVQTPSRHVFVQHWYKQAYYYHSHAEAVTGTTASTTTTSTVDDDNKENNQEDDDDDNNAEEAGIVLNGGTSRVSPLLAANAIPPLRPNLVRGHAYEVVPREVYAALQTWYGEVSPGPLCIRAMIRATTTTTPKPTTTTNGATAETVVVLPLYGKVRVPSITAAPSLPVPRCAACGAAAATSKCLRCLRVRYCHRGCQESHWVFHKLVCQKQLEQLPAPDLGNIKDDERLQPIQQQQLIVGHPVSRVGLNNLGNTCFMNSALQCLSHAAPLTRLFLSGLFRADLNQANPLGTGGKLANAYDVVMKDLWLRRGCTSTSPTALKRAIALFAPRFAGCLQHDAQEFLAYLLDGLHEDLNRVRDAPYVEMPEMQPGQNMAVAGARAWDAHRRRNDSLVLDTFYGQFKSTCVCPKCSRVSESFDVFNHISLEIPQAKNAIVPISVLVFPSPTVDGAARVPVRYGVEMRRSFPISAVRENLANLCGIAPERLNLCEVFEHNIHDTLKLHRPVSDIRPDDFIVAYEVDPYSNTTMHALVSHNLVVQDDTIEIGQSRFETFGFPFMTSFPAEWTCRQVWDSIWKLVERMVTVLQPGGVAKADTDRKLLKIRLHNGHGKTLAAFPLEAVAAGFKSSEDEEEEEDAAIVAKTAFLPPDLDEKLTDFLGPNATDRFVFLSLDWSDERPVDEPEQQESRIDEHRFEAYENHESWIDVAQRFKASTGTKSSVSLGQCLDAFTKPERLDEHNMWYCSNCKEHVQAMKTMELWRLPNVLIVHLKRFEFKNALRRDKLDTLVDFPVDGMDMSRHCASWNRGDFIDDGIPAVYDLFAVTNHYGRMGFGHYTAFARPWDEATLSEDWSLFDDSSVSSVGDKESVVSSAAYVLFYRRRIFS